MQESTQKERLENLMKRPVPRKKVDIVHLTMVKEARCLYGMRQFTSAKEVAEMVTPLFKNADREMLVVISLNSMSEPQAVEVVAVGGVYECIVDVKNIFKHALLVNASYVICIHNHPSGSVKPSREDYRITERIYHAGELLNISLIDHIIIGDGYYSMREHRSENRF